MSTLDINNIGEFLAHAHALEVEAAAQYDDLAEQMDVHNNPEVAELFRKLAEIEGKHVNKIDDKAGDQPIPHIPPWEYKWEGGQSPEGPVEMDAHYMMTPHHALRMALGAEERAADFFQRIADNTTDDQVRSMSAEMAAEEREHIQWLNDWLQKYPEPDQDWDEDMDPPMLQE
jgi:rubrerythrin